MTEVLDREQDWTLLDHDGPQDWTFTCDYVYRDGQLFAAVEHDGTVHHFHLDHLGTPRLITDQNDNRVALYSYYPLFGQEATDPEQMVVNARRSSLDLEVSWPSRWLSARPSSATQTDAAKRSSVSRASGCWQRAVRRRS